MVAALHSAKAHGQEKIRPFFSMILLGTFLGIYCTAAPPQEIRGPPVCDSDKLGVFDGLVGALCSSRKVAVKNLLMSKTFTSLYIISYSSMFQLSEAESEIPLPRYPFMSSNLWSLLSTVSLHVPSTACETTVASLGTARSHPANNKVISHMRGKRSTSL